MIALRRTALALAAVAALLSSAAPAMADIGPGGPSYRLHAWGLGADVIWSTFPADGVAVPGVVYTDTSITVSEQGSRVDGTAVDPPWLLLFQQDMYKFDRHGDYIPLSDIYGSAAGSDLDLSVDSKLTSASATATIQYTNACWYRVRDGAASRYEQYACGYGVGSVSASWAGHGDLVKQTENTTDVTKVYTRTTRGTYTYRDATASGSWNGVGIAGQQVEAKIIDSASRDVFICHGAETC